MKKNFTIVFAGIILLTACSREGFLDIKPKGVTIPSTIEDYRLLLDQVNPPNEDFGQLSRGFAETHSISVYLTDNQNLTDLVINEFFITNLLLRAYLFDDNFYNINEDDEDWNNYYNDIYIANIILDGITTVTNGTEREIAILRAEAQMHKAFAYFNLVNLYGLHYNPSSASTDLGVPVRQGIVLENVDLTRASVQETYDLILDLINSSMPDLLDIQPSDKTFRPSKAGAYGLLSKVKLYQGKYEEALTAAEATLALNNTIRDINDDRLNENNVLQEPAVMDDPQIIWFKRAFDPVFPSSELLDLYESNDARLKWYRSLADYFNNEDVEGFLLASDFSSVNGADGINTPDILLIRAECHARLGNISEANTDLNTLREKRFETGTFTTINITDPAELLQEIKDERRREMAHSTQRIFDIKRYNLFDNDNIAITHTLRGQTATLEANSKKWALPIAPKYILRNPEIVQNPRD